MDLDSEITNWVLFAKGKNPRYMTLKYPAKTVKDWKRQGWVGMLPYNTNPAFDGYKTGVQQWN